MSQFGIIVNVDKCIGCQACFVACKEENKVAPGIQWNQIHRAENLQDRIINYFRVSCQHCDNPACLPVCPAKAIYKGPHGEVLVDQSKCIGCGACTAVCTAGNLTEFNFRKVHTLVRRGEYQGAYEEMNKCMLCGKCRLVCPRGINTRGVVMLIKRKLGDF